MFGFWAPRNKEVLSVSVKHLLLDLVSYDITSSYFEEDYSITMEDIRQYGYSRDHRPERRQVVIGVVTDLKERFGLKRMVFVGDRGMLSEDNLEHILEQEMGFIVCHRLRKNNEIKTLITDTHDTLDADPDAGEQFRVESS